MNSKVGIEKLTNESNPDGNSKRSYWSEKILGSMSLMQFRTRSQHDKAQDKTGSKFLLLWFWTMLIGIESTGLLTLVKRPMFAETEVFFFDSTEKNVLTNGKKAKVQATRTTIIFCIDSNCGRTIVTLSGAMYALELQMNLVSVSQLVEKGANIQFETNGCELFFKKEPLKHRGL